MQRYNIFERMVWPGEAGFNVGSERNFEQKNSAEIFNT